ncbi:hypothetical protein BJ912DRAFT_925132 [Pholiota molesta]|nr:hypothetical protein BJ912DRAFT_925132 [Pholiota molesta]
MTPPTVGGVAAVLEGKPVLPISLELFALKDRVCIVTGADRGMGLEIALALAEAGGVVYGLDLPAAPSPAFARVQEYVGTLPPLVVGKGVGGRTLGKGRLEYAACDVTQQAGVWALVAQIAEKEGGWTCAWRGGAAARRGCAGLSRRRVPEDHGCQRQRCAVHCASGGRAMVKHNSPGSIILIGSISGSVTNKGMHWTAYNTSKAAVIQMARSIACELGPKGIRCNSISPATSIPRNEQTEKAWCDQNPLGRLANPQEIQGVALFLASDASSYCTGSNLIVDGGMTAW